MIQSIRSDKRDMFQLDREEKALTRVDEFKEKYPSLPRDFITKWELNQLGIQDTDDLDKASTWRSIECWYREIFPIVVPGKAKHASYDGWMQALDDALDIC